ncbi:3-beta-hydroxysteroid-Delta(8),Delta(7)-isomerase [Lachnellula hyalina]|uniref:3-beta-hydroxysteroid-Delta(8), Delta(7)-isomerase n=1 Tax=Lachnellula hyalina TaxID=1316788 RepID=A0A8H8R6H0_9HELO|nr:3-beta-hydroxysteroid-Delta(8),Delta(7)-isomerase [Lachnellula hyalina]TVY29478.1 3-beta-hydroxysteroid-Delta(8),Delta(7)-isomerase [Lachnellula hyalina]
MAETDIIPPPHPYYPEGILLSGSNFIPNSLDAVGLVAAFGAGCTVILGSTLLLVKRVNPSLKFTDRALILWWDNSSLLRRLFHVQSFSNGKPDGFVWSIVERITWGPLSFLTAVLITKDSPYRHAIQALVSTGQFYGDFLYYTTSLFDDYFSGRRFYRPEPYYFWFYFVVMNAFWIIIPLLCLYSSIKASARAFALSSKLAVNGSVKKTL